VVGAADVVVVLPVDRLLRLPRNSKSKN